MFFKKFNFVRTFREEFMHILLLEEFEYISNIKFLSYNIL